MHPFMARTNGPIWLPLAIFLGFIGLNLIAAFLKRVFGWSADTHETPSDEGRWTPSDRFDPVARPTGSPLASLSTAERQAKLERQLRGGPLPGRTHRTDHRPPPLPPLVPIAADSEPLPSSWAPLTEAPAALQEAHERLAYADAVATAPLPPLAEAPAALQEGDRRLADADARTHRPHSAPPSTLHQPSLAAEMGRSLRDPATARGSIIAAIILGPPKALE